MQIITKYDIGECVKFKRIITYAGGKKKPAEEIHVGIVHKVIVEDEKKEVKPESEPESESESEEKKTKKAKQKSAKPRFVVIRTVKYLMRSAYNSWIPEDQIMCALIETRYSRRNDSAGQRISRGASFRRTD